MNRYIVYNFALQPPYRIEVLRPDQLGTKELGELDFLSRQLAALESEWNESPINPQFFIKLCEQKTPGFSHGDECEHKRLDL